MANQGVIFACVNPQAFAQNEIRPSLMTVALWSPAAEQLLLATAIHESQGFRYRKQKNGPALGVFQMEPYTHNDIWNTYLNYRSTLASRVTSLLSSPKADKLNELEFNDKYAAAMARIKYARSNVPLPKLNDIAAMATYWKQYYNTPLGRGTTKLFIADWNSVMTK